eukprot:CAMPEP_0202902004 /NCGR_PEP_ID=MMETSP1392-20130828/15852_1 /ASSEMBLY_ACC=CAM_ASM_000868 /TAXON_ID=225041 /ORGANISM="Chlamydomonas chlamydogama, Strain SAG 11-48b" /LENGTH=112 /DNA_ID=CAMNT_0049588679 /DNA_START=275 /DNA_END=613 /DNA_ORIENTATION=-
MGFLPWNGCDQGGFYSTGTEGTPGKDCQMMYQPAAGAEKRFAEMLQGNAHAQAVPQPSTPSTPSRLDPGESSGSAAQEGLSSEAQGFLRDELAAELSQRNKQLVDDAWQSLE